MCMAKRSSFRRLSTGKDENFEDFDIKVSPMLLKVYPVLTRGIVHTGKSLSEAPLLAEHGENMLCTKIVLNVRNNFCTQHVLPRFELGIFMY